MERLDTEALPIRPTGRQIIEDVGRALALGAVLLPAAGVLVRYIAFYTAHTVNHPLYWALAAPLPELALIGLVSLVPGLLVLPQFAVWAYVAPREHLTRQVGRRIEDLRAELDAFGKDFTEHETDRQQLAARIEATEDPESRSDYIRQLEARTEADKQLMARLEAIGREIETIEAAQTTLGPPWFRWNTSFDRMGDRLYRWSRSRNVRWSLRALSVMYWIGVLLFVPWPVSLSVTGLLLTLLLLPRIARRTGRVALSQTWPLIVFALLVAAIAAGLDGELVGAEAGSYHFAAEAHLLDGRYVRLGEASNRTVLVACSPQAASLTAVDNGLIRTMDVEPWKDYSLDWPTIFGLLAGQRYSLGFKTRC
jgi:hypothetical protein